METHGTFCGTRDAACVADERNHREKITQLNQHNSPLLRLPAKLRNRIYEAAFCESYVRVNKPPEIKVLGAIYANRYQEAISLLITHRQTRHEAMPLFYDLCTLDFGPASDHLNTLGMPLVGLDICSNIRSIRVNGRKMTAWDQRRRFENSVHVEGECETYGDDFIALRHVHVDVPIREGVLAPDADVGLVRNIFGKQGLEVHCHGYELGQRAKSYEPIISRTTWTWLTGRKPGFKYW